MSTSCYPFIYFICANYHLTPYPPIHSGFHPFLLLRSAAIIQCSIWPVNIPSPMPLSRVQYSGRDASCSAAVLQKTETELLKPPLPYTKWDTVNYFPPIMPDLVLLHLYCRRSCCNAYWLPSSSSVNLIILHLFCCVHCLTSLPHLCC